MRSKCGFCEREFDSLFPWMRYCSALCRRSAGQERRQKRGRRGDILRKFAMTAEQYDQMAAAQQETCAICRKAESAQGSFVLSKKLAVDHDHQTGEIRGLLCQRCNIGIGMFLHDETLLRQAIVYIAGKTSSAAKIAFSNIRPIHG